MPPTLPGLSFTAQQGDPLRGCSAEEASDTQAEKFRLHHHVAVNKAHDFDVGLMGEVDEASTLWFE